MNEDYLNICWYWSWTERQHIPLWNETGKSYKIKRISIPKWHPQLQNSTLSLVHRKHERKKCPTNQ